jgi:hypothetical protein
VHAADRGARGDLEFARALMSGMTRIPDSRQTSRHVRNVPLNEPASQERAARGGGDADGVTS